MVEIKHMERATYELFHSSAEHFSTALRFGRGYERQNWMEAFKSGKYQLVFAFVRPIANVDEQLEQIFFETQNLDEPWHPRIAHRSTSVGDVVKVGDDFWVVASIGFTKLNNLDPNQQCLM
jgi:hypothetical protein